MHVNRCLTCTLSLVLTACSSQPTPSDREALIARAAEFELDTEWEQPPGDPMEHAMSGFAKILCSALFITGLDIAEAAENVGYFVSKPEERVLVTDTVVDYERRQVSLTLNTGPTRTAKLYGDQGCVTLAPGEDSVHFTPVPVVSSLPGAMTQPWPMGDVVSDEPLPSDVDATKVAQAVDAAFAEEDGLTAAFVVVHRGRIIGERYGAGLDKDTQLESWSMGKSLTATLMGTLIQKGVYELWQPAPIEEWHQTEGDPRAEIRIGDLMRMSSGLRFVAPQDPDYALEFGYPQGYPDHLYVYTGSIDSPLWARTRPAQWPPNTVGRYRNSDPVTVNYLIRKGVEEQLGQDYFTYPQRELFDKIGIRKMYLEPDPYGTFLLQGYEYGTGRNWARLGMLYLQDGVWNGERILPEGWVEYASTVAPAWEADGRPTYGGAFFWINGGEQFPIPEESIFMAGAGGQYTIVIPSHEMVVVRLGHAKGSGPGVGALRQALALLMEAVPAVE
ncbi:MAG: serine hydrolase [Gemmatimonadota bacterium]|nr:MAG: serine hydrolase [Gemmatimonadota bacterium]